MDFYLTALLQGLCFSGIVLGIYLSMKIFSIPDITTDGSYTLGGVVCGILLAKDLPFMIIFPIVCLAGAAAGALTGLIHTKLKVNSLLAGILVMTALYSVNLSLLGRSNLPLLNFKNLFGLFNMFQDPNLNALLLLICFTSGLIIIIGYTLMTDFGIAMRATGNSESMVRAMGVNTDRMKITGLAIANALTAASGFLMVQFQGFADINMGIGIVITGLGSVVIGEVIVKKFKITSLVINLGILLAGAVLFQLALAFTLSSGANPIFLKLLTAVFVLLIVSVSKLSLRRTA